MPSITTTLAAIRAADPCKSGYKTLAISLGGVKNYGKRTPIDIQTIIESNGLIDAIWVLTNVCGEESKMLCYTAACDFAEHVLPFFEDQYPDDTRPRAAIEMKRRWLKDEASDQELPGVAMAAIDAATAAARASRTTAASAARAAASASWSAYTYDDVSTVSAAIDDSVFWALSAAGESAFAPSCNEKMWQTQHLRELLGEERG